MQHILPIKPLERHELATLANLNPRHKDSEIELLSFYYRIKSSWSNSAIKNLQSQTGLRLTSKLNRCEFARLAAIAELEFLSEREQELAEQVGQAFLLEKNNPPLLPNDDLDFQFQLDEPIYSQNILEFTKKELEGAKERLKDLESQLSAKNQKLEKIESFSVLLLTNRLLPPGPPLNGTEDSPAMRILGSPKTLTELEANYRELIKREHPDVSVHEEETATSRFMYVRSLYRLVRKNWEKLKPTAVITVAELERRLKAPVPFPPESFW